MPASIVNEPAATQGLRHARQTIILHWLTAILVVLLWCIGQTIDWAPNHTLQIDYRSLHMLLGVTLGVVLVMRIIWRTTSGGMLPALDQGLMLVIARATHYLLYALLIATVVLGLLNVWVRGDSIFNLFQVPAMVPGDKALRHQIGSYHALAANAVLIVAGLHSVAALFHHFVLRDATLRRMLPWSAR
jgi:cytochrome b561